MVAYELANEMIRRGLRGVRLAGPTYANYLRSMGRSQDVAYLTGHSRDNTRGDRAGGG